MTTPQRNIVSQEFWPLYDQTIVELMKAAAGTRRPAKSIRYVSHPLARAVRDCGTAHIYTDTADQDEMFDLLVQKEDAKNIYLYEEIDGNTTNQPLIVKVLDRFLVADETCHYEPWIKALSSEKPDLT